MFVLLRPSNVKLYVMKGALSDRFGKKMLCERVQVQRLFEGGLCRERESGNDKFQIDAREGVEEKEGKGW